MLSTFFSIHPDDAKPDIYNILKFKEDIVVEALNIGLMTTITTTPSFMDYEIVHFVKNRYIKAETMDALEYIEHFYPFEMPEDEKRRSCYELRYFRR